MYLFITLKALQSKCKSWHPKAVWYLATGPWCLERSTGCPACPALPRGWAGKNEPCQKQNLSLRAGSPTKTNQQEIWSRGMPLLWQHPVTLLLLSAQGVLEGCPEVGAVHTFLWKLRRRRREHWLHHVATLWFQRLPRVLQISKGNPVSSFLRLVLVKPAHPASWEPEASSYAGSLG